MNDLFALLRLTDVHRDVIRNVVSTQSSQNPFDDLTGDPDSWALAQQVEDQVKPPPHQSRTPIIDRPFEDADWGNAIEWPFKHWQSSRFSDGTFGIWYGCGRIETSVRETAHHWFNGLLADAGFEHETVRIERTLYRVACNAALVDLRPMTKKYPGLIHKKDYRYAQSAGLRLHREGHPGLVTRSVRHAGGENYAILNPRVLSNPRPHGQLTYRSDGRRIVVEKKPGVAWLQIAVEAGSND